MTDNSPIFNPQYDGNPFFWPGNPIGVLLVHGFTATVQEVRLLAVKLHEKGYSIGAPLLPGHYTQPADLNRVKWQDWIQASEEMFTRLQSHCQAIFVGGESTGALVALYLAGKHPEVAGILTYAPALKLAMKARDIALMRLIAPFVESVPKGSLDASNNWQGYPVNPLKGAIQLLMLQKEIYRLLPKIRQPVLIMQGRLDTTVHPSVPGIIAQRIGSQVKEIHWMERSSHCVLLDQELDQVDEITENFIQRCLAIQGS